MNARLVSVVAAGFAAASVALAVSVRAEDPAADMFQKKIVNPLLTGTCGEWSVTFDGNGPAGPMKGTAKAKLTLAVGGTALVEDYESPDMMPGGFFGHGVTKVSADGKTVTTWWLDNMSPEPIKLTGPLSDTTSTIEGEIPGMGAVKIVWKSVDGGFDFIGTMGGKPWLNQQYRRAK